MGGFIVSSLDTQWSGIDTDLTSIKKNKKSRHECQGCEFSFKIFYRKTFFTFLIKYSQGDSVFADYNAADAYLNRGGPVSVHLPIFVVVTLKLQLQVRPAGGGIAQSWRLGWVGLSNIPHLFSSSGVFLVSQGKMFGGVALQIHSEATWRFWKSWFYLLKKQQQPQKSTVM